MQSIGERLEEARKRKGISIREAAESTKIRSDYLHKFENNQYDIRLPEIYVRGFLRSYASFLKLPSDKIIADYNALNHVDPKASQRVNREVYGRMDISTTKEPKPQGGETPALTGGSTKSPLAAETGVLPSSSAAASRTPVTFIPSAKTALSQIDKKLLIKAASIGLGTLVALILIIVFVFRSGGGSSTSSRGTSAGAQTWVQPQPGERAFDIVAKNGPVTVKATADDKVIFHGTIQPGDKRTLPRRAGMAIEASPHVNVEFIFDGQVWPMEQPRVQILQ